MNRAYFIDLIIAAAALAFVFSADAATIINDTLGSASSNTGGSAKAATAAASSDKTAMISSLLMAGTLATMCNNPAGNYAPCVMSAMAAAQAVQAGKSSSGATDAATQDSTSPGATMGAGASTADSTANGAAGTVAGLSNIKNLLAAKGAPISADGSTITLPNGSSVGLNAGAGSDASLSSAGLSASQIAEGKASLADAQRQVASQLKSKEMSLPGGGGGGGGGGGAYAGGGSAAVSTLPGARKQPSLSGLTKNLGGDKIGVSADNIFDMVSRRYKAKDDTGTFVK